MNVIVFAGVVRVCNLAGVCVLVNAGEMTRLKKDDKSAPPPPVPASLSAMTSASTDTEIGPESGGLSARSEERGQKQRASRPPVSAGTSKFVWYAVAVVVAATIIAVHASYESPDRP
jgi:hypothetical protein